jgi:hypothetical protein
MMDYKINCVWCRTKSEFDALYKSSEYDLAVSYHDIYNRLVKSDPCNKEPSSIITSLYIRKLIKKSIDLKKESGCSQFTIIYLFKSLNSSSVDGFYKFISDVLGTDFSMNLIVINRSDFPKKGVLSKFDNVRFVENAQS